MMPLFKVWDATRTLKYCVVASDYISLLEKGKSYMFNENEADAVESQLSACIIKMINYL
jgi:hypothetical protein